MPPLWFILAIGAAISWGVNYVLTEKILENGLSVFILMLISGLTLTALSALLLLFGKSNIIQDSIALLTSGKVSAVMVIGYALTLFLGCILINYALLKGNATTVSLVEITYPIFVVLFSWLLFKETHLNMFVVAGGLMVLSGSALVLWKG